MVLYKKGIYQYNYTGNMQKASLPPGKYRITAYGASGGGGMVNMHLYSSVGGPGGITIGLLVLTRPLNIYIYVGGAGVYGVPHPGGWNGGGKNGQVNTSGSGGGATDIRLIDGDWDDLESLKSRILVAGGGGGADNWHGAIGVYANNDDGSGGAGGGLESQGAFIGNRYYPQYGATQSSGNAFGIGGSPTVVTDTGGGGGGWYGGYATNNNNGGGGRRFKLSRWIPRMRRDVS